MIKGVDQKMQLTEVEQAVELLCKNCKNFEICGGTGCGPKKEIIAFINVLRGKKK